MCKIRLLGHRSSSLLGRRFDNGWLKSNDSLYHFMSGVPPRDLFLNHISVVLLLLNIRLNSLSGFCRLSIYSHTHRGFYLSGYLGPRVEIRRGTVNIGTRPYNVIIEIGLPGREADKYLLVLHDYRPSVYFTPRG